MTQRYLQPNNNNTQWFVRANTIIGTGDSGTVRRGGGGGAVGASGGGSNGQTSGTGGTGVVFIRYRIA